MAVATFLVNGPDIRYPLYYLFVAYETMGRATNIQFHPRDHIPAMDFAELHW